MVSEQTALSLPAVAVAGSLTLFRYTSYDVPFWVRPNSRPGRWHVRGDPPTQYWSMTPDAAWAELIRAESLTTEDELDQLRMPLWVGRFPATGLIDLGDDDVLDRLAICSQALVDDDWSACQSLGRELRRGGHRGVITPCAALDQHWNVTIFGPRRLIDWRDRAALARTVPAAVAAIGRPPRGLIPQVQHRADPSGHPSLF